MRDLAEPIEIYLLDEPGRELPAVLSDLSSGGMSLTVFAHVSGDTRLRILLNIPGLEGLELQGHVVWTEAKGDTTNVGVRFNHVSHDDTRKLNQMAEGYQDCELKISFGLKDVCYRECPYWALCEKPVKLDKPKH